MKINRFILAVFALFAFTGLALAATVTNAPVGPVEPLPASKSEFWTLAIAAVTPILTALIYKWIPKVPKLLIPALTPVIGIGLGLGINALGKANLGWVDMAQAGALAVFLREIINQAAKTALIQGMLGGGDSPPPAAPTPPAKSG